MQSIAIHLTAITKIRTGKGYLGEMLNIEESEKEADLVFICLNGRRADAQLNAEWLSATKVPGDLPLADFGGDLSL